MENRQRTIRKLLWRITAVLAVLAVVSICFVSGTFARYVSNRNGSTVTDVAKWDIDFTHQDQELTTSTFALVNKLSPSKNAFTVGSGGTVTNREKSSGAVLVLMITNNSDVDAELVITPPENDALTFYGYDDTDGKTHATTAYEGWSTSTGTGFKMANGLVTQAPTLAEAQAVITMQFALTTEAITDESKITWQSLSDVDFGSEDDPLILKAAPQDGETQTEGTSVYCFYVRSVWTSRDEHYYDVDPTTAEDMSDGLDTWLGENIAALGGEFTFSVVQASEWPTTP